VLELGEGLTPEGVRYRGSAIRRVMKGRGLRIVANGCLRFPYGGGVRLEEVGEILMSDILFIAGTIVFIALGIVYLKGCEKLK